MIISPGEKRLRITRVSVSVRPGSGQWKTSGLHSSAGNRWAKFARTAEAKKSLPTEGDWEWGGCGDNVNFGFKRSRDFMDAPYRKRSDIKTLVKLHNNDAGRLVSGF